MKDYSEWKPTPDFENDSPWVNPSRPWLKYRPSAMPKTLKFDPIPLHEAIQLAISQFPNNVCVYDKPKDKQYTYRELGYYAARISNALHELGVGKGDGVGIMSANCAEFVFSCLGILETGATIIPINPLLHESDVTHIVRESGNIKVIFVHSVNYRTIKKTRKQVEIDHLILLGSDTAKEGTVTFSEFIEGKAAKLPDVDIDPNNDLAALLFTGGTTGLPKGVMLTHNNIISAIFISNYTGEIAIEEREAQRGTGMVMTYMPLCHVFGFMVLNSILCNGHMAIIFPFSPSEALEVVEEFKIKFFAGVPVMYQMIINSPDFTERDLSSLEFAISGAAALAPELAKRWEKVVGIKVGQGYGLTEGCGFSNSPGPWLPKGIVPESIGTPILDTDLKIVDTDTLEELKPGEVGEIWMRGPQVMKGYWNRPIATKKDLVGEWLRTGDLGKMDKDGYFYIEGRSKDMIKYKAYKVMAKEVENKLMEHPAILEVGVVGVPDPNIGETIKAFVVLKKESRDKGITERDIIDWSKDKMAGYKYPRIIEFIKALPRTAVGKPDRKKLRENG